MEEEADGRKDQPLPPHLPATLRARDYSNRTATAVEQPLR